MIILHANDEVAAKKINDYIDNGFDVFMLIYMEGCGPCNAVRPEWADFHKTLEQPYLKNNKLVIVDVNKDYSHLIKKIKQPEGFPTIIYVSKKGDKIENFEDAIIPNKTRNADSFINWVENNINDMESTTSNIDVYNRISHTNKDNKRGTHKRRHLRNKGSKKRRHFKKSHSNKRNRQNSQRKLRHRKM